MGGSDFRGVRAFIHRNADIVHPHAHFNGRHIEAAIDALAMTAIHRLFFGGSEVAHP